MLRALFLTLFLSLIYCCTFAGGIEHPATSQMHIILPEATLTTDYIKYIQADGHLIIHIIQNRHAKLDTVTVESNPDDADIDMHIEGQTLIIKSDNDADQPIVINIQLKQLRSLEIAGKTYVSSKSLYSLYLTIISHSQGDIVLAGGINLREIVSDDIGNINVRWIDSHKLTVHGNGEGQITLIGRVYQLDARLCHRTYLDARYLRAQNVWISTTDFAQAKVQPVNALRAFALRFSDIYFYREPARLTRASRDSGNVLNLSPDQT